MPIPVAVGDNVRLILKGTLLSDVEVNNVFYAHIADFTGVVLEPVTLQDTADGLWQTIKAALLLISSAQVNYTEIVAESLDADANLINGESYLIASGDGVGATGGDCLPPADAYTFKFVRDSSAHRHGFKRFAGVPEAGQSNGQPTSGLITDLNSLSALLAGNFNFYRNIATVETNIGGQFHLTLVQRRLNGDVVSPAVFYDPLTVVFDKIGHQDTRDFGRGV